ncbi:MAG: XRE family transcriptional regulator [Longicatena sp.]
MKLSELIRYYRSLNNMSLEAIGDYVGVAKSTVKRWESGESKNIPSIKLEKLSELFGIDVFTFLNGQVKPILGYVKAGYDLFANENLLGYEEVTKKEATQGDYYLKVQGDSMSGSRISDGDLVYVKNCCDVENGDIAVVLLDHSEVTIKKIIKKDNSMILMATNPAYEPKIFNQEDIQNQKIQIIGKVLHSKIQF